MFARYYEDRVYDRDHSSAGGYHQTPLDNYMDEISYPRSHNKHFDESKKKITRSLGFNSMPRANKKHIESVFTATLAPRKHPSRNRK